MKIRVTLFSKLFWLTTLMMTVPGTDTSEAQPKWTIVCWENGDSGLAGPIEADVAQMASVAGNDMKEVVILVAQDPDAIGDSKIQLVLGKTDLDGTDNSGVLAARNRVDLSDACWADINRNGTFDPLEDQIFVDVNNDTFYHRNRDVCLSLGSAATVQLGEGALFDVAVPVPVPATDPVHGYRGNVLRGPLRSRFAAGGGRELDMGSKTDLKSFLNYAWMYYWGKRNMFVLGDHGGGVTGISWDYHGAPIPPGTPTTALRVRDLRQSLEVVPAVDIILLDCCLMSMFEPLYELRNRTTYVVAAETISYGIDNYDKWIPKLRNTAGMSSAALLGKMFDSTPRIIGGPAWDQHGVVWAGTRSSGNSTMSLTVHKAARRLLSDSVLMNRCIWEVRNNAWNVGGVLEIFATNPDPFAAYTTRFIDMGDYGRQIYLRVPGPGGVSSAASDLYSLCASPFPNILVSRIARPGSGLFDGMFDRAHGISIYYPFPHIRVPASKRTPEQVATEYEKAGQWMDLSTPQVPHPDYSVTDFQVLGPTPYTGGENNFWDDWTKRDLLPMLFFVNDNNCDPDPNTYVGYAEPSPTIRGYFEERLRQQTFLQRMKLVKVSTGVVVPLGTAVREREIVPPVAGGPGLDLNADGDYFDDGVKADLPPGTTLDDDETYEVQLLPSMEEDLPNDNSYVPDDIDPAVSFPNGGNRLDGDSDIWGGESRSNSRDDDLDRTVDDADEEDTIRWRFVTDYKPYLKRVTVQQDGVTKYQFVWKLKTDKSGREEDATVKVEPKWINMMADAAFELEFSELMATGGDQPTLEVQQKDGTFANVPLTPITPVNNGAKIWKGTITRNDLVTTKFYGKNEQLRVKGKDLRPSSGNQLDAKPGTLPQWDKPSGAWKFYEDENGNGASGGVDVNHKIKFETRVPDVTNPRP